MRKWHRWLSVFFGVFMLGIAVTGVASQIVPIVQRGGFEDEAAERGKALVPPAQAHEEDEAPAKATVTPAATPAPFVCPETMICRPKPPGGRSIVGLLHHLHSGEIFGPLGVVISILTGLSLIFFSFSGLWLYIHMWRQRRARKAIPRWFWK